MTQDYLSNLHDIRPDEGSIGDTIKAATGGHGNRAHEEGDGFYVPGSHDEVPRDVDALMGKRPKDASEWKEYLNERIIAEHGFAKGGR